MTHDPERDENEDPEAWRKLPPLDPEEFRRLAKAGILHPHHSDPRVTRIDRNETTRRLLGKTGPSYVSAHTSLTITKQRRAGSLRRLIDREMQKRGEVNYNPIVEMAKMSMNPLIDERLRFLCMKEVAEYLEPKLRSIEPPPIALEDPLERYVRLSSDERWRRILQLMSALGLANDPEQREEPVGAGDGEQP